MRASGHFLLACCTVLIGHASLAQERYKVDSAQVNFVIKNFGLNVNGSFQGLQADLAFDPNDLSGSFISASLPSASVETGIGMRDRHLLKPKWFDAERYPNITMISEDFRFEANGRFIGVFRLRIKDTEQSVEFPFSLRTEKGRNTFEGSFTIDRRDFGVGGNSLTLADEVTVQIYLQTELAK